MILYFYNLLIGIDQFANVILGGAPDQTISSRCWKHREHWVGALAVKFIDWLFSWYEDDHCQKSYESGDRNGNRAADYYVGTGGQHCDTSYSGRADRGVMSGRRTTG